MYQQETIQHPLEKLFACNYPNCSQVFRTKFSCKRHRLTHTKEKLFACERCGKRFTLAQHLKEHSYRHSKKKPYICGVSDCQQAFRHASELSLHRRTHPEYQLRQYHYLNDRSELLEQIPSKKTTEQIDEARHDSQETDEKIKPSTKPEQVFKTITSTEFCPKTDTLMGHLRTTPTFEQKKPIDDTFGIDNRFLEYLISLTTPYIPVTRPALPLPRIYVVQMGNSPCSCTCKCHFQHTH